MSAILILALTLMSEARGESVSGRKAVASVIWNRAHSRAQSWEEVCLAPKQFSYWNGNTPSQELADKWKKESPEVFEECMRLAEAMVTYTFKPSTAATHFYNPELANPDWAALMEDTQVIGRHIFGRVA